MSIGGTNPRPGRIAAGGAKSGAPSGTASGSPSRRNSGSTAGPLAGSQAGSLGASAGVRHKHNGKTTVTFRETIPSDHSASHIIQQRILNAVQKIGFTPHSSFAIKLALEEAMINAIKHGNKLDPSKSVHIEAKVTPKVAEITIEDEGPGFDRSCVPDPTLEENLEKCSGRGILLIEAYMNRVEWSHHGRRLRMVKRNGEEPGVR